MDRGMMAINGYSAFPKAPALLEPSDGLVLYPGHSLGGVLPLCRDAVDVFYSASWLGNMYICMFMCAYIYIYIYVCVCVFLYIYIYIYIYMKIYVRVYIYIYIYMCIYRLQWVNCCHFKLLISQMYFVWGFVSGASKLELGAVCGESSTIMQFISPEFWKWHAVLFGIHTDSSSTKISQCLSINPKSLQRIWKELDEFNGDYEGIATLTLKLHSDQKRIPEFLCEIKALIDNNPSKSGVVKFLIGLVVHKDICFTIWERTNFYHRSWKTRGKIVLQTFSTNSSIPSNWTCSVFSHMKKNSARIRWWTHKINI